VTSRTCRGCGAGDLQVVLDLGQMPLANGLLSADRLARPEPRYPLALAFCPRCYLTQITDTVEPEALFREYAYFSSVSDAMVEHSRAIVNRMVDRLGLDGQSLAVELASNDGYLLQHYVARGVPVLGIDPARNIAEAATARGIPTIAEFFGADLAQDMARTGRVADVVHANNVLAHVPDLHGFIAGIAAILKPNGVAVIETPYVRELVERLEFDTIYHEHVFYYSVSSLARLLEDHRLAIVDVERLTIHGGSLRIFAMRAGAMPPAPSVAALLEEEAELGMTSVEWFNDFGARVQALGDDLWAVLGGLKSEGKSIAAYGAAAKGAVLLNAFGIGRETLDFVADRSPHKEGLYLPGVRIPVVSADHLVEAMPDACLLLAWNFADEILAQQSEYRRRGGAFVIPVPTVRVVEALDR
jgi:SAM-dependent methyltransferase